MPRTLLKIVWRTRRGTIRVDDRSTAFARKSREIDHPGGSKTNAHRAQSVWAFVLNLECLRT
jgi:hypothetical protein